MNVVELFYCWHVVLQTPSGRGRKKREAAPKPAVEGDEEVPGKPYECQRKFEMLWGREWVSVHYVYIKAKILWCTLVA